MFDVSLFFRCIFSLDTVHIFQRWQTFLELSRLRPCQSHCLWSTAPSLSTINLQELYLTSLAQSTQAFLTFFFSFFNIKRTLYSLFQVILNVTFYFVFFFNAFRDSSIRFLFFLSFLSSIFTFPLLYSTCHHLPFFFLSLIVEIC